MRSRTSASGQVAEVARRRLELLSAELAEIRPDIADAPSPPVSGGSGELPAHAGVAADPSPSPGSGSGSGSLPPVSPPAAGSPSSLPGARSGRHARRGVGPAAMLAGWVHDRLPATLQGRVQLGATHLTLVAVAVALALGLTAWWSVRAQDPGELAPTGGALSADAEEPLVEQAPGASGAGQPPRVAGGPGGATLGTTPEVGAGAVAMPQAGAATEVVVDVAGRVRRPGIVRLPVGARVVDALEAAGGARPRVDLRSVNLARLLVDGEQVLVGVPPPAGLAASAAVPGAPDPAAGTTGGTAAPQPLVNINTADLALLDTLPGVGPVTAEAIIGWRTDNGGFTAVDDLLDVSGIGEATLAELAPLVTV